MREREGKEGGREGERGGGREERGGEGEGGRAFRPLLLPFVCCHSGRSPLPLQVSCCELLQINQTTRLQFKGVGLELG